MITEMIIAVVSWPALVILLLVFGFAPGAVLRLLVRAFHRDDLRRQEMLAEIHAVPRLERPFWVAEQLEVAISEGIWGRIVWAATGRIIHRWRLGSGVESNRRAPETFYIPPGLRQRHPRARRHRQAHVSNEGWLGRADVGEDHRDREGPVRRCPQ
jgi:hypothetical protein